MSEPIFIKVALSRDIIASGEPVRAWIQRTVAEARQAGATWPRVSWTPEGTYPVKVVVEGWATRPESEGAPRFQGKGESAPES